MTTLQNDWTLLQQDHSNDVKIDVHYSRAEKKVKVTARKDDDELTQTFNVNAELVSYDTPPERQEAYARIDRVKKDLSEKMEAGLK